MDDGLILRGEQKTKSVAVRSATGVSSAKKRKLLLDRYWVSFYFGTRKFGERKKEGDRLRIC